MTGTMERTHETIVMWNNDTLEIPVQICQEEPHHNCKMEVLTKHDGGFKMSYDNTNKDDVAMAKATFDALKAAGYVAHMTVVNTCTTQKSDGTTAVSGPTEEKGDVITEFDATKYTGIMFTPMPAQQGG